MFVSPKKYTWKSLVFELFMLTITSGFYVFWMLFRKIQRGF